MTSKHQTVDTSIYSLKHANTSNKSPPTIKIATLLTINKPTNPTFASQHQTITVTPIFNKANQQNHQQSQHKTNKQTKNKAKLYSKH